MEKGEKTLTERGMAAAKDRVYEDGAGRQFQDPGRVPEMPRFGAGVPSPYAAPTIDGDAVQSLTSCSINLHPSCDFHNAQKYQQYLHEWRHPAPKHCTGQAGSFHRPRTSPALPPAIAPDLMQRLGVNMQPVCDAML